MRARRPSIVLLIALAVISCLVLILTPHARPALADKAHLERSAASLSSASGFWRLSCIRCAREFTRPSDHYLRIDSAGRAQLAYGGDALYYAVREEGGWRLETADPSPSEAASLALDSSGRPVIAYYDRANADLKVARRMDAGWQVEVLDSTGDVGFGASLGIDPSGQFHVAYLDATRSMMKYAFRDAAGWHLSEIAPGRADRQHISLALAPSGAPSVAFFDDHDAIRIAALDAGAWRLSPAITSLYDAHLSLVVDDDGRPLLLYAYREWGASTAKLYSAEQNGAGWSSSLVDDVRDIENVSLSIGPDGKPQFTGSNPPRYDDYDQLTVEGYVWQGWRDGAVWHFDAVEADGAEPDIALSVDGGVRMAFFGDDESLQLATMGPVGGWSVETVDHEEPLDGPVLLALDNQDQPHLAYTAGQMQYARLTPDGWQTEAVSIGTASPKRLAVDSLGQPRLPLVTFWHLHYEPEVFSRLSIMDRRADGWSQRVVEDYYGYSPSLDVDPSDGTHLAFAYNDRPYDPGQLARHELRYLGPGQAVPSTIGAAYDGVDVVVDSVGHPHISSVWSDEARGELTRTVDYHTFDGSAWKSETVVTAGSSLVMFSQIVIDGQGRPAILYSQDDTTRLARRTASGWTTETVLPYNVRGMLAFDSDGVPHIAFPAGGQIRQAYRNDTGWQVVPIAAASPGTAFSFVAAGDGRLMLAYLDPLTNDLQLAVSQPGTALLYLPLIRR